MCERERESKRENEKEREVLNPYVWLSERKGTLLMGNNGNAAGKYILKISTFVMYGCFSMSIASTCAIHDAQDT